MDEKRYPLEYAQRAGSIAARDKGHDIIEGGRHWRIERDLVYVTTCVKCGAELVVERSGPEDTWVYGCPAATRNCPA